MPRTGDDDDGASGLDRRSLLRWTGTGALATVGLGLASGSATAHTVGADFKGCSEVWLLVLDPSEWEEPAVREGGLCATVCYYDDSAGSVATEEVCFTREDATTIPGQHGDTELFKYLPPDPDDKILAVKSHRGGVICNDHRCAENVENTCFDGACADASDEGGEAGPPGPKQKSSGPDARSAGSWRSRRLLDWFR